jgi:ATP-dependent protease ClpP protease subunit
MGAEEALDYGLVDKVIERRVDKKESEPVQSI